MSIELIPICTLKVKFTKNELFAFKTTTELLLDNSNFIFFLVIGLNLNKSTIFFKLVLTF